MSPFDDRVTIEGPHVVLTVQAAQNFALATHELATNAAKYGALSNDTGRVLISWSVTKRDGHSRFTFRWRERDGPQVTPPTRKGFGSAVLEQVMVEYSEIPPQIEFTAGGVTYEVTGSLEDVAASAEGPSTSASTKTAADG
jgi:two-component sensor histidine kinase